MLLSVMTPVSWRRCGATPVATLGKLLLLLLGPRAIALGAASRAAAARTKPSETSRLPTTGMCQDEDRTEMPRAGTAEARSSAPTRQHRKMAALLLMAAARILGGLRPRRVCGTEGVLQRRCAALLESLGSSRRAESSSLLLLKKTVEVQRRQWLPARHAMSLRAGLGQVVLAPTGILNQSRCDAVGGDVVRGYSTALHIFYPLMVPRVSEARRRREALREPPQAL